MSFAGKMALVYYEAATGKYHVFLEAMEAHRAGL